MAFTRCALLARIRPAFWTRFLPRPAAPMRGNRKRTQPLAPGTSRTVTDDPLTARSADVRTLLTRTLLSIDSRALFAAAIVAALSISGSLQAQAPNPAGANASRDGIGVVDISYIFKKHERFPPT